MATLTARVTPGYQFSASERPTTATLNLLATPTITIYGTVDGTTGLTPGSVTGSMLADSVRDGTSYGGTLDWVTISGGRALQVQAAGLVNTNSGIIPIATTILKVYADTNYFTLATNSIARTNSTTGSATNWLTLRAGTLTDTNFAAASVKPNKLTPDTTNNATGWLVFSNGIGTVVNFPSGWALSNNGTNTTLAGTNTLFTSPLFTLPTAAGCVTSNTAHGLAITNPPSMVRWVLVCQTNDCGYLAGDEVDVAGFSNTSDYRPTFSGGGSTNYVFLAQAQQLQAVNNKLTGARDTTLVPARWKAKCYAAP